MSDPSTGTAIPVFSLFMHVGDANKTFHSGNSAPLSNPSLIDSWEPFFAEARDNVQSLSCCVSLAQEFLNDITGDEDKIERARLANMIRAGEETLRKLTTLHGGTEETTRHYFPSPVTPDDLDRVTAMLREAPSQTIGISETSDLMSLHELSLGVLLNPLDPHAAQEAETALGKQNDFRPAFGTIEAFTGASVRAHTRIEEVCTQATGGDPQYQRTLSAAHQYLRSQQTQSIGDRETLTPQRKETKEARRSAFRREQAQHASRVSADNAARKAAERIAGDDATPRPSSPAGTLRDAE